MKPKISLFVKNYEDYGVEGVGKKKLWKGLYHNKSVRVRKKSNK